ncbi:hypothetical protein X805_24000 [Sphaerotilus natans subsp. natans DSM 6575]|uniref:Fibronectin type-III domain-containing protein n=1 Tax=Sphaerotilus natans subsp. natans DSM 6575 TaxID=1286631 RepID=A0A059KL22_9BURK|nr:hypothetical protein [Sphaerotilus natans]KDB52030.1 hypothetical protein X805_24000 [Sphaerotilus natans subsp. natans DSM 6575]SIQ09232.1 hypothetical protein SAMN05421778_101332 [Sphaerotilus natans]
MSTIINLQITEAGRQAALAADGKGLSLSLTHLALGKARYAASIQQTAMREIAETVAVTSMAAPSLTGAIKLAAHFGAIASDAGYPAYEMGLWAGHPADGGVLFAVHTSEVADKPIIYRGAFDYTVVLGMTLSAVPDGSVTVVIDDQSIPAALAVLAAHERSVTAHDHLAAKAGVVAQAYSSSGTAGTGSAYTMTVAVKPEMLRFARVVGAVHAPNAAGATLAVNGLAAAPIKVYDQTGAKVSPAAGRMAAGMVAEFVFDGADWVLLNPAPAAVSTVLRLSDVTVTPAPTGGDGSAASPLILPEATSAPGVQGAAVATIAVTGMQAGEFLQAGDRAVVANGSRFSVSAGRIADGAGRLSLVVAFSDTPSSASGTRFDMDLVVGGLVFRHRRNVAITTVVSQPAITSPIGGATGVGAKPTISASAFTVSGGTDTHKSSTWQIASDSSFATIVAESAGDTTNKVSWVPAAALEYAKTYFVRVRYTGVQSGDSAWSAALSFTTQAAPAINRPAITSPAGGATGTAIQPSIAASAFAVANGSDVHQSSHWQIASDAAFTTIVAESAGDTTNKVSWKPSVPLAYSKAHFVRVRYTGAALGQTAWSDVVSFTTAAQPTVNAPTISTPAAGATAQSVQPTISILGFTVSGGTDSHASSTWQIASDSAFTTIVAESQLDATNLLSWKPASVLSYAKTYYARAKVRGTAYGDSAWSAVVSFTTAAQPVVSPPAITAPTSGSAGNSIQPTITAGAFSVAGGTDSHASSTWQIASDAAFTTIVAESQLDATNKVSWKPSAALSYATNYFARVKYRGTTYGDSAWSAVVSFTTAAKPTVNKPTITSPASGATGMAIQPTITIDPVTFSGGTDSHASSTWQIASDAAFTTIVAESQLDATNKVSWKPSVALSYSKTYYVRVKARGAAFGDSEWSSVVSMTTMAVPTVTKPTVTAPSAGAASVPVDQTFAIAAFAVSGGTDSHASTTWQLSVSSSFATIAVESALDATNKVSWKPSAALSYATTYYLRVRVRGATYGDSAWSDVVSFTTAAQALSVAKPTITSPVAAAIGVTGPIRSSAFALATGSGAAHTSSDWQISASATFDTVTASASLDTVNLVSWQYSGLTAGTTYYVRVRHNSATAGASDWSDPVAFTTIVTTQPTIISPASGSTGITSPVTLEGSAFASTGQDTLASVEWHISTLAGFTVLAAVKTTTTTTASFTGLSGSTRYYARARYTGAKGGVSAWSPAISFTTAASPGVTWTAKSPGIGAVRATCTSGGRLVAVGSSQVGATGTGAITSSADNGATWETPIEYLAGVRIGTPLAMLHTGTRFVAVGYDVTGSYDSGAAYLSADGKAWSQVLMTGGAPMDLATNGSVLVAVGTTSYLNPIIRNSADGGSTWTNGVDLTGVCGSLLAIEWCPEIGLWIAGGLSTAKSESYGAILTSPDRINWTPCTLPADVGVIMDIAWNGSMGVAVGMTGSGSSTAGVVLTTTDGVNWTRQSVTTGALSGVDWVQSQWVAVGYTTAGSASAGAAMTSADGKSWILRSSGAGRLYSVAANGSQIAACGYTTAGSSGIGGVFVS